MRRRRKEGSPHTNMLNNYNYVDIKITASPLLDSCVICPFWTWDHHLDGRIVGVCILTESEQAPNDDLYNKRMTNCPIEIIN